MKLFLQVGAAVLHAVMMYVVIDAIATNSAKRVLAEERKEG